MINLKITHTFTKTVGFILVFQNIVDTTMSLMGVVVRDVGEQSLELLVVGFKFAGRS